MNIALIRDNIEIVKESQRKRGASTEVVDEILNLDNTWRKLQYDSNNANKRAKDISKEISNLKKQDPTADTSELREKSLTARELARTLNVQQEEILLQRNKLMSTIGNIVHESVPVSLNEADFTVVRTHYSDLFKENPECPKLKHHQLLYMIGGYEPEIGSKVAGHRGYYLTGFGVILNQAIIQYSLYFLWEKGYQQVQPPLFMKQSLMEKVASIAEFDESLYKIEDKEATEEGNTKYLIATSEAPLVALNMDKIFVDKDLPLKYAGLSECFRKEAGSSGKDIRGLFRTHVFEKVEQFVICKPDESWNYHEEMIKISEEFYNNLGISYRIINIPSGDLNMSASKKYDLEGWFPGQETYRELVSCSNCTDYQSRQMNIQYGTTKPTKYVHMLNSTLCATGRTICAILENYQTENGIKVPEVLKPYLTPYLKGSDIIPFVRKYDLVD